MSPILTEGTVKIEYHAAKRPLKPLNCDQVSFIMNALERLIVTSQTHLPMASRMTKATQFAALLEIMEVLGYEFEDSSAAGNALSLFWEFNDMRRQCEKASSKA